MRFLRLGSSGSKNAGEFAIGSHFAFRFCEGRIACPGFGEKRSCLLGLKKAPQAKGPLRISLASVLLNRNQS